MRNLADAASEAISADTRYACAFEAAIALITMAVAASGYRVSGPGHHRTAIRALTIAIPGDDMELLAGKLDRCRRLRNELSYETAGVVSGSDVVELFTLVTRLRERVEGWLLQRHPGLQ